MSYYDGYEIRQCRNFYGIFLYGKLIQTADTHREAEEDLKELLNEQH